MLRLAATTKIEGTMGRHGVGMITDNGERVVNFCQQNDLVIEGTLFAHKEIYKLTWTSLDGRIQKQIDRIITNGRWRHSLQDVRVMRHADIGSDHSLLVAKVTLKLRKAKTRDIKNQRYDVVKLKDPKVKEEFRLTLRNSFNILEDEAALTIEGFNRVMKKTGEGEEVLGFRKSKKTEWISEETLKERISKEYSEKDKVTRQEINRRDKRRYIERLAEEAETAAEHNDMKTVYQNTKKLKGDYGQHHDHPVRAVDGTHVTLEEEKLKRWKQRFESILNSPDPPTLANIPEAEEDLDINLNNITATDVNEAIHKLKNGKEPGDEGVCPEMLKAEDTVTPQLLCQILQKIWESKEAPSDWKTGTIVKLPKKETRGTILEQSHEWNGSLYVVFVDFEKALESLHRDSLWKILRHYGIPQKLVNVIRSLYENFECRVIHNNLLTEPFQVETGVKQGCILSPLLFSMAIDWIMRRNTEGRRQGIQ
ncbi:uncharacterized protein LOC127872590 [Dreissena polymorpha]|uniref:uncharacterized protein LOC127872590 n=1 Tax=Dreissena polymorpha TaxID=45954 RepID=UPI0022643CF7|nr:uncharacterized protein LOC127872590 [Dreissena polymorpha]